MEVDLSCRIILPKVQRSASGFEIHLRLVARILLESVLLYCGVFSPTKLGLTHTQTPNSGVRCIQATYEEPPVLTSTLRLPLPLPNHCQCPYQH
jgi:hypothetical protein